MRSRADRLHVVHVLSTLDVGGIELRLLDLVRALPPEVHTTVLTLGSARGSLEPEFERAGARIVPVPMSGRGFGRRLRRTLRDLHPDAVHSHAFLASGYLLALAATARVPVRVANFQSDADPRGRLARRIREGVLRLLITVFATRIVGVSDHALEAWRKNWRRSRRARVLTNGFDLDAITEIVRSATPAPDSTAVILHVGRADLRTKNRDRAIEVFHRYRQQGHSGRLVFVGRDGRTAEQAAQNRAELDALARTLGVADDVAFLGERSDVIELMATARALLFTSSREGVPGTVVEALAAGLPVVASDIPGCTFIRDRVPGGITCLPLSAGDDGWASALAEAVAASSSRRPPVPSPLAGSEFDVRRSARELRQIWSGR